jgi:hypothetical protein
MFRAITIFVLALLLDLYSNVAELVASQAPAKTAEDVYKNIQALKGTPADQLLATMQFLNESLGVSCEFCHVGTAFEKDDKPSKQVARRMILMQVKINRDNFDGHRRVTCYSCHRGLLKVPQR